MDAIFFPSGAAFHAWLAENHVGATAVLIGFYKNDSAHQGITYDEALDEALCYGWIDGVRKGVDAERYTIRFTLRKRGSIWSAVNLRHMERLIAEGRVQPAGLLAYETRDPAKTGLYSFERDSCELTGEYQAAFQANGDAWTFFRPNPHPTATPPAGV